VINKSRMRLVGLLESVVTVTCHFCWFVCALATQELVFIFCLVISPTIAILYTSLYLDKSLKLTFCANIIKAYFTDKQFRSGNRLLNQSLQSTHLNRFQQFSQHLLITKQKINTNSCVARAHTNQQKWHVTVTTLYTCYMWNVTTKRAIEILSWKRGKVTIERILWTRELVAWVLVYLESGWVGLVWLAYNNMIAKVTSSRHDIDEILLTWR
jgi:hypothetical protein